ncbi:MAG: hypothetical protein EOO75_18775 [Myxococcales bacterium]|nr:MAG: hypothetical protein EOO75_18775 [Myxococcales bacterium]
MASGAPAFAPTAAGPAPAGGPWSAKLDADHPLVGKLWDTRARAFIDAATLGQRAQQATFVLLGERHDHPDHHRLQAQVVAGLARAGRRPTVVFEMIEREQQGELDAYLAAHPGDAAGLGEALRWQKRGWPDWAMYRPIAEAALAARLPLAGGNLASTEARAVVKGGLDALGPERRDGWGLRAPLPAADRRALEQEMHDSHCGQLPAALLPGMADAQQARDAALADRLLAAGGDGAVLIAGAGHVRSDRAVPRYVGARKSGASILSVAFREVSHDQGQPGDEPYDVVWFTPRLSDEDPCATMMKR